VKYDPSRILNSISLTIRKYDAEQKGWLDTSFVPVCDFKILRVVAFNVWIKEDDRIDRINALIDIIKATNADVVALVEMTLLAQQALEANEFIQKHFYCSLLTQQTQPSNYKTSIFSKLPFSELTLYDIPWTGRKVVSCKIKNNKGFTVTIMSVHLFSDYADIQKRADELVYLEKQFKPVDHHTEGLLIMGDYNFHHPEEDDLFSKLNLIDCWAKLNPRDKKKGNTYDKFRLDRIGTRNLIPLDMQVLPSAFTHGTKKLEISDHCGLFAILDTPT